MNDAIIIGTVELVEKIRAQRGCTFATIKTDTIPKIKKTCPISNVHKVSHLNVMIGFNYENAVNNQRSREEIEQEFSSQPRKWGVRVDLKTVEHNGKTYLTYAALNHYSTVYIDETGNKINTEVIKPYLYAKSHSNTQMTEKEIIYRDVNIENVREITMNGQTFKVI